MAEQKRDFRNILVIHFGQLGDVVLALPAFRAIREAFPNARITALTGKIAGEIIRLSGFADQVRAIDRVELRDGPKFRSIRQIMRLTREIRNMHLDLVIDLHSLKETNILAWLSGANRRLLANRGNRSYHWLGNFNPPPPAEDRSLHLSQTYMRVLSPLGLGTEPEPVVIEPDKRQRSFVTSHVFNQCKKPMAGFFPGAGHPNRRWPLERFGSLAEKLNRDGYRPIVFLGPEELEMMRPAMQAFPEATQVGNALSIAEFIAAIAELEIFVTNDTGPMHLAALAGTPILLIMDSRAPLTYLPLGESIEVVNTGHIDAIDVDEVYISAQKLLRRPAI